MSVRALKSPTDCPTRYSAHWISGLLLWIYPHPATACCQRDICSKLCRSGKGSFTNNLYRCLFKLRVEKIIKARIYNSELLYLSNGNILHFTVYALCNKQNIQKKEFLTFVLN